MKAAPLGAATGRRDWAPRPIIHPLATIAQTIRHSGLDEGRRRLAPRPDQSGIPGQ
jgi:hypothetical protein